MFGESGVKIKTAKVHVESFQNQFEYIGTVFSILLFSSCKRRYAKTTITSLNRQVKLFWTISKNIISLNATSK